MIYRETNHCVHVCVRACVRAWVRASMCVCKVCAAHLRQQVCLYVCIYYEYKKTCTQVYTLPQHTCTPAHTRAHTHTNHTKEDAPARCLLLTTRSASLPLTVTTDLFTATVSAIVTGSKLRNTGPDMSRVTLTVTVTVLNSPPSPAVSDAFTINCKYKESKWGVEHVWQQKDSSVYFAKM